MRYLKDETLYKVVWSLIKSSSVTVSADSADWYGIKDVIKSRCKDEISPKVMSDLLVLSTMEAVASEHESDKDLFSLVEEELMAKMKFMALDDLINLLWTS